MRNWHLCDVAFFCTRFSRAREKCALRRRREVCCACVGVCHSVALRRKNCTVDPQVCYKFMAPLTVPFFLWGAIGFISFISLNLNMVHVWFFFLSVFWFIFWFLMFYKWKMIRWVLNDCGSFPAVWQLKEVSRTRMLSACVTSSLIYLAFNVVKRKCL